MCSAACVGVSIVVAAPVKVEKVKGLLARENQYANFGIYYC